MEQSLIGLYSHTYCTDHEINWNSRTMCNMYVAQDCLNHANYEYK